MARRNCSRRELLDRWRAIQEELEEENTSTTRQRRILREKEDWFCDSFGFLVNLPKEDHIWCDCSDLMGPLLETFHGYLKDENDDSPLKLIWRRISQELRACTQCICQHHQAQESYNMEYESDTVDPLLKILCCLDEERVTENLKEINTRIHNKKYDPETHCQEVISVMFEVLMFPGLLEDQLLVNEFQLFIEAVDDSHEVNLSSNQQYPGIYALLFFKNGRARAVGLRLAGYMGKLRRAADLEPLQPLLRNYIRFLEVETSQSTMDYLRPRVQLELINVWHGFKTLLGFLEAEAFEDGILEKYPIFLSIVLNHVSDETPEFSCAVACLRATFEMLGCKLWLRTSLSPSMMRNTLLGQCFHTQNEKSHKDIFDLFLPFLQSLEALQDGEHDKQRRHLLYFLLHQVTQSRNFSALMRKNACKIALLIIHRGYTMNPPYPPFECAHMWCPSLVNSLRDSSLHISLRQPAFDLISTIIVSDASALISLKLENHVASDNHAHRSKSPDLADDDEQSFANEGEENFKCCWSEFDTQKKLAIFEYKNWSCIPMLWFETLVTLDPLILPISFSKAVFWVLAHISGFVPGTMMQSSLSIEEWLSANVDEILTSFSWEVPSGSDDGGDGKGTRNTVKASFMTLLLIKAFKRFATHFILRIEQHDLQKQWTWEPRMAECLMLLLVDPDDKIRQADRVVLEHVSKTRGLTPGLQFLCSSASSLSAVFSGLKLAIKQVLVGSLVENFNNLHHLFFIARKLLNEMVTSDKTVGSQDSHSVKFVTEGGFLQQPCSGYASGRFESSVTVDKISWEKFSCLLSEIIWHHLLRCIKEGEYLFNNKNCQMTCVRLLEILPVVYGRLCSSQFLLLCNVGGRIAEVFDLNWFSSLVDWGKSSLLVVTRHWKQCMLAVLNCFKSLDNDKNTSLIASIEATLSHDAAATDEVKAQVLQLIASAKEVWGINRQKDFRIEPSSAEQVHRESALPPRVVRGEKVVVLSDDEAEKMPPTESATPSLELSNVSKSSIMSKDILQPFPSKSAIRGTQILSQSQAPNVASRVDVSCKGEQAVSETASSLVPAVTRVDQSLVKSNDKALLRKSSNVRDNTLTIKNPALSGPFPLPSVGSLSSCTEDNMNSIIKEVRDDNDPLERALDRSKRPQSLLTIQNTSAPKRQVFMLQLPTKTKYGLQNRMVSGVRRFKPPKLDEWYKPILELDYFMVMGITNDHANQKKDSTQLKEVPLCFQSSEHYVEIFKPLILEEFKAQLQSSYAETSMNDMSCGYLSILSVERIDDFQLIRGCPDDEETFASRGCAENDLILLTKKPLQQTAQDVHMIGKVERREKSEKSRSTVFAIRFYLSNNSSRLAKAKRLLVERSKWFLSRIMSMTPQLREFQALSSLTNIPILPIILDPVNMSMKHSASRKVQLELLPQAMQKTLMSSYNESQLHAITVSIVSADLRSNFELSLIQGPPGTGKTRTIVAIVSSLLAIPIHQKNRASHSSLSSKAAPRAQISQSAAIARAWQDAAFAKQLSFDGEKDVTTECLPRGRILICAQSNAAVDELVLRISAGLYGSDGKTYKPYLVRVGNSKTVHSNSLPFHIDRLVDQRLSEEMNNQLNSKGETDMESSGALRSKFEKVLESIRHFESKRAEISEGDTNAKTTIDGQEYSDAAIGAKLKILYGQKKAISMDLSASYSREKKVSEEHKSLKQKIRKSILREAEIVLATLSGCGGDVYGVCSESVSSSRCGNFSEQILFDVVIIDEAAQALEPATLIPLQLLKSYGTKCVMVGDPKQLPATVLSSVASKLQYECSMFERLQRAGHPVVMLTEQYRMHPEICRFPSMHFYENKLVTGGQIAERITPFHKSSFLGPYMFFDVADGSEYHEKGSGSLYNEAELTAAVDILKFLKKRYPSEFSLRKIGIVTPYRSQLSRLRYKFSNAFGPEVTSDIEFNTVDGFQGREVDILVLSTVRASSSCAEPRTVNSNGIGFVADVRRMNVALTRAKYSLWIIGNARTLRANAHWDALVKDSKDRNLFISITRPYYSVFHKDKSLSTDNLTPGLLSQSNQQELGKRHKEARNISRTSGKDGKNSKSKLLDWNQEVTNISNRCNISEEARNSEKNPLPDSGSSGKINEGFKGNKSRKTCRQDGDKNPDKQKGSANFQCTSKNHLVHDNLGEKNKDNSKSEMCSLSHLIDKAKCAQRSSEHHYYSTERHGDSSALELRDEAQHQIEMANKDTSKNVRERKDLIATRKRQREDVDALLPSALISSKKSETSLNRGGGVKVKSQHVAHRGNSKSHR